MLESDGISDDVSDWGSDFDEDVEDDKVPSGDIYEVPDGKPSVPIPTIVPKPGWLRKVSSTSTISSSSSSEGVDENVKPPAEVYIEHVLLPTRATKDEDSKNFIETLKRKLSQKNLLTGKNCDPKTNNGDHINNHPTGPEMKKIKDALMKFPWFYRVDRSKAELILENYMTDGAYLVRECHHGGPNVPFTLTIRFQQRLFHIQIRLRPDSHFALGTLKHNEMHFPSVAEMIDCYKKSPLQLHSNGKFFAHKSVVRSKMAQREMSTRNLASPWRFRDGNEYLVSLSISDKPKWISVTLQDKVTAEEWSCQFDLKYIEKLTQRTGNYKPFATFVTMIKSAILKKSDSVTIELMSYEDLLALKSNKNRIAGQSVSADVDFGPNFAKFDNCSSQSEQHQVSKQSNKYLIVTYVAEFDKVHYPLPLRYTGYPDASVMQQRIEKLRSQVTQLKETNADLIMQLQTALKSSSSSGNNNRKGRFEWSESDNTGDDSEADDIKRKAKTVLSHDKLQSFAAIVKELESRMENERAHHKDRVAKLEAENDYLRNKLKAIEKSESNLKDKVTRLESVLAMNVGLKRKSSHAKAHSVDASPKDSQILSRTSSLTRHSRAKLRGNKNQLVRNVANASSRCSSIVCDRDPAPGPGVPISFARKASRSACSSRQSSCERRAFNPTEYVKQKKLKQERMAQMRLAQVENRIRKIVDDRRSYKSSSSNRKVPFDREESAVRLKEAKAFIRSDGGRRRDSSVGSEGSLHSNNTKMLYSGSIMSPSPSGRSSAVNVALPERLKPPLVKSGVHTLSSFDRIRHGKEKRGKNGRIIFPESKGRFRNAYKTDKSTANPLDRKTMESNVSLDKLQQRLQTMHAFLDTKDRR